MKENYRQEKSIQLIEKYEDLIEKTFSVVEQDKLKYEIEEGEGKEDAETKYLSKIKARKNALDEVVKMLDSIKEIEKHLPGSDEEETTVTITKHPTKRFANK